MEKKIVESCENCRFACSDRTLLSYYECRKMAPAKLCSNYLKPGSEDGSWPIVYRDKWCGQWEILKK
ncbi:MAG: hypothetical protein PHU14_09105 [Methylovulum sp.]|nr:hypothetical protein [Methylovulum sp.]